MPGDTILTTCPRDCYDACGILVTLPRMGASSTCAAIRSTRQPRQALPQVLDRLQRRVPGPAGAADDAAAARRAEGRSGGSSEVGWHEAIAAVAGRLARSPTSTAPDHAERALHRHLLADRRRLPARASSTGSGATEVEPDTVCNNAGHVALDYVYGARRPASTPSRGRRRLHRRVGREPVGERAARPRPLAARGARPADRDRPDPHADRPRRRTSYLQLFPGSDAALAFALVHVIRRDGLVDEAFLAEHVLGYDELEPLLERCTPAWGEE